MGLLTENLQDPLTLGLLSAGTNMMGNNQGIGAAISHGLSGFLSGILQAQSLQQQQADEELNRRYKEAQIKHLLGGDDIENRLKLAQAMHYENMANDPNHGAAPYFSALPPTTEGLMLLDNRTGKINPAMVNNKPLQAAQYSPENTGAVTAAKTANQMGEYTMQDGSKVTLPNSQMNPALQPFAAQLPLNQLNELAKQDPRKAAQALLPSLMNVESSGNPLAVSPKGAQSLYQIMPETAKDPGFGIKPLQNQSIEEQQRFATDYLAEMIKQNNGDVAKAVSAYNQGLGNLQHNGITNSNYVNNVLNGVNSPKQGQSTYDKKSQESLAEANVKQNQENQQKVENSQLALQALDRLAPFLFESKKFEYDNDGNLVVPKKQMIVGNTPIDRAKIGSAKYFGVNYPEVNNLAGLHQGIKQLTVDAAGGKLGSGISDSDIKVLQDTTGITGEMQSIPQVYQAIGQLLKRHNDIINRYAKKPIATDVDALVKHYRGQ